MDWSYNTIWWDQMPPGSLLEYDFKEKCELIKKTKQPLDLDIEYAIIWYYRNNGLSFANLPASDKLLFLELNWANNKDFFGIERFPNLKKLEMQYCTKLETDAGISVLRDSIEYLHINQSKKLASINEIAKLTKLKGLRLNSCGPIESLEFLKNLPNLIDFRFVNTNVLDGDLTPLIEHPNIRSVGFFDKRHYNYRRKNIDKVLDDKSTDEYMDFVYKGEYETFRFK